MVLLNVLPTIVLFILGSYAYYAVCKAGAEVSLSTTKEYQLASGIKIPQVFIWCYWGWVSMVVILTLLQ